MTKSWLVGSFVPHRLKMLESPAWKARTVPLMRILERLEVEYLRNGGRTNGSLFVSYGQFEAEGISRRAIRPAIRLGDALGLLEANPLARKTDGNIRPPNAYRLTYLPTARKGPTDEWNRVSKVQAEKHVRTVGRVK